MHTPLRAAALALCVLAAAAFAAEPPDEAFSLADAPELSVSHRGKPFLVGEGIAFRTRSPDMKGPAVVYTRGIGLDNAVVGNVHLEDPDFGWRREAAITCGGQEVEITFQGRVGGYVIPMESTGERLGYSFSVDARALDGMRWKVQQGRSSRPAHAEGVFSLNDKNGALSSLARYIAFTREDGSGLFFDLNPEGPRAFAEHGPGNIQGLWTIEKRGDRLVFSVGHSLRFYGGSVTAKAVIFEGNWDNFPERHATARYSDTSDFDYERAYVFGAEKFGDLYTDAGRRAWNPDAQFGWVDAKNLSIDRGAPSGALYSAVEGREPATFRVSGLRPGVYIVTARTAAYAKAAGPFSLSLDGRAAAEGVALSPNEAVAISWPVWIEDGAADFRFDGQWRLSALVMQFLMHSREDYKFRRGIWHLDGFEPALLFHNAHYAKPPVFAACVEKTPLAPHGFKMPANYRPAFKAAFETPPPDRMPWRYTGNIGSYGPGNQGEFDAFGAMADKERRVEELRNEQIDVVIVNGLLSRHTFPAHIDRTVEFIRDFTAAAHRRAMRVIDHHDFALLWNMDSGFRVLTEQTDRLQHRLDGDGVSLMFCPMNPKKRAAAIDYVLRLVKEADIDGLMLDEVMFQSKNHCGCRYCREAFTLDSGLVLPMDETNPALFNTKDRLWRAWITWRYKALAEVFLELRRAVTAVKPDFSMLAYTTHYGWITNWASHEFGADILLQTLSHDFVGTEIMTRNVMVDRRPVMAYRKMKSAIGLQYDKPVFGLVYDEGDGSTLYFGWALNTMNRQSTWFITPPRRVEGLPDFLAFTESFPRAHARPRADTAMLFSRASRDWPQHYSYGPELQGTSQTLTDRHLMHEFVLGETLAGGKAPASFRNLLVMNAASLSDAEVAAILSFAKSGGSVYLSGHAGLSDELGMERGKWPFADAFGFGLRYPFQARKVSAIDTPWGAYAFEKPVTVPMLSGAFEKPKGKVLATMTVNGVSAPLAVEARVGTGRLVYAAIQFGGLIYESEQQIGAEYKPGDFPELAGIYGAMLADLYFKNDAFQAVAIPDKVMVTTTRVEEPDRLVKHVVNFLNATGIHLDAGAKIPSRMSADWGRVDAPIVFRMRLDALKEAYAVSPDFDGRRPVDFKAAGKGIWEITLPADGLKHYTQVHLAGSLK